MDFVFVSHALKRNLVPQNLLSLCKVEHLMPEMVFGTTLPYEIKVAKNEHPDTRPRQGDVDSVLYFQVANLTRLIGAHNREQDDVILLSLVVVHGLHLDLSQLLLQTHLLNELGLA